MTDEKFSGTIVGFRSENVRKITVVEFKPTPTGLVVISGKNGQGKTSVLDTIEMVLGGADHIPHRPVRKGQDKATGELDLGEYLVTRTVTPSGGGSLTVRNKDGEKLSSPQQILDGLYGKLSFDPLDFARQKPAQRGDTLRALLGLDFTKLDAEKESVYDRRTIVNKDAKAKEAALKVLPQQEAPAEELSAAPIIAEQREAIAANEAKNKQRVLVNEWDTRVRRALEDFNRANQEHAELEAEIERLTIKLKEKVATCKETKRRHEAALATRLQEEEKLKSMKAVDISEFGPRLVGIEAVNAKVRSNKARAVLQQEHRAAVKESDRLTSRLEAIEREKRDAIAAAKWPVPGLGFSETNEVTFNGIPFDGCSTAEQLKISVAMGLALNPKLRVLLVRQGNDLDDDNLLLMAELAQKAGAQIWLERVSSSGQACIVIEDGQIKEP